MAQQIVLPALAFAYSATEPSNTSVLWYDLSVNSINLTDKIKVFNKTSSAWESYYTMINATNLTRYIPLAQKAAPNGVATLGSNGLVPPLQLGNGLPSGLTYLRGDGTWQAVSGLPFVFDLNGQTGGSQTFATVNDTNITLSENSAANIHTFTAGWTGLLSPARGGTGVNNGAFTTTLSGNLQIGGGFNVTLNASGNTTVTLPTTGTILSSTQIDAAYAKLGGNTNGSAVIVGTNDNYDVTLERNNTEYLKLTTSGVKISGVYTMPTADGTSGQALLTNGSGVVSWGNVDALPSQTGNNGKYLTTNGTVASWAAISGGGETLAQTLVLGNSTSGTNITITNLDVIQSENTLNTIVFNNQAVYLSANGSSTVTAYDNPGINSYSQLSSGSTIIKANGLVDQAQIYAPNGLRLGLASTYDANLVLQNATNANTITIQTGAVSASYSMTLPSAQGTSGQVLTNNGSGSLSWSTISAGGETLAQTLALGNTSGAYDILMNSTYRVGLKDGDNTFTTYISNNQSQAANRTAYTPLFDGQLAIHATGVPLVSGRITYATTNGLLTDSAYFTWNNSTQVFSMGDGAGPMGSDFNVTKNLAGGVYGSIANDHANGIAGLIIGKDGGEYAAWQKYAPSRGGNFNGTSVPFADLTTLITSKSYSLNSVPLLVGASVHYQTIGITGTNLGTRLDGTGYRIGTLADIHTANTYLFQVGAGLYYSGTELTGPKFVTSGGTSGQFVKGDGTLDSSTYLTTAAAALAYQPLDATLTALAGLATGANKIPYSTGADTFSQLDFSTNTSLGASDTTVSSQNAVKTYVDTVFTDTELALVSSFRFLTNN